MQVTWKSNLVIAFGLVFYLVLLLIQQPWIPHPTDDLFYIDAAYKIAHNLYAAPTKDFPFHHYLRWPVILPLALLIKIFGYSSALIGFASIIYLPLISLLLFFLLRMNGVSRLAASVATFTPLVLPPNILAPRILSEGPALFWSLSALLVLHLDRLKPSARIFLSGALTAIAINATTVVALSIPAFLIYLAAVPIDQENPLALRDSVKRIITKIAIFISGLAVCYSAIIFMEWIICGDPLIELHSITWWHLHETPSLKESFFNLFDLSKPAHSIIGLTQYLAAKEPIFILSFVGVLLIVFIGSKREKLVRPQNIFFLFGVISYLSLELFGAFVIPKNYPRFLVVPIIFCCAGAVISLIELCERSQLKWVRQVFLLTLVLFASVNIFNNVRVARSDGSLYYYKDAIDYIVQHHEQYFPEVELKRVAVYSDFTSKDGLNFIDIAVRIYSNFKLMNFRVVDLSSRNLMRHKLVYYITDSPLQPKLDELGFQQIPINWRSTLKPLQLWYKVKKKNVAQKLQPPLSKLE